MRPKRPQRRRPDRIVDPDLTKQESASYASIAPFDRLATTMDRKWGVNRLEELVSPETARKWGEAMGMLNDAIRDKDPEACQHAASVCMRGLKAMDAEAASAGHTAPQVIAEYELDGFHFAIIGDNGDWAPIKEQRPDLRVYSLREIAVALQMINAPAVDAVKNVFPQAEIRMPKDFYKNGGDDIPFGETA